MKRTILGLVGEASSGKGEIASFLQKKGFIYYSLSNTLRDIATSLGLSHDRELLTKLGNTLRDKFGGDILARGAKQLIEENTEYNKVVIDSIRNPREVTFLQQEANAFIIGISIIPEKRFQLMRGRNRLGDPTTWEEFQSLLALEQGVGEKATGIQVKECLVLANTVIKNDGSLEDLHTRINEVLFSRGIGPEGYNPYKERL